MGSYTFDVHGGTTVDITNDTVTISVVGVKGWIFQRIKPSTNTIQLKDVVRIDYKKPNITVGFIRFMTPDYLEYPSSVYVAEHDPQAFIFDKADAAKFEQIMMELKKVLPNVSMQEHKL